MTAAIVNGAKRVTIGDLWQSLQGFSFFFDLNLLLGHNDAVKNFSLNFWQEFKHDLCLFLSLAPTARKRDMCVLYAQIVAAIIF